MMQTEKTCAAIPALLPFGVSADCSKNPSAAHAQANDMARMVSDMMRDLGIPAHILGYGYLRDAILLAASAPELLHAVTKRMYPLVARANATTASRVERAMRHAIEVAWDRGDVDVHLAYFGCTIQSGRGKPTNTEFIAMLCDRLRLGLA